MSDAIAAWLANPFDSRQHCGCFDGALQPRSSSGPGSLPESAVWDIPNRMTLSFAPDGTNIAKYSSDLYSSFGYLLTASELENTILRAFQEWARHTSVNVGLAADGGQAFGIAGPSQRDSRFGDIRVGAIPMAPDVFAISVRHDAFVSGTWAGDIIFNSNATFADSEQFYAVALHEAGHVLGLGHSTDPLSVMNPAELNATLTAGDIANIRLLYGDRALDQNELGGKDNNSLAKATRIENPGSLKGSIPYVVYGDIHNWNDVDFFELPGLSSYSGPITFRVVTQGISVLAPRLSVFNEAGTLLMQTQGTGLRGSDISVTLPQVVAGRKYYARVDGWSQDIYGVGSYALVASFDHNVQPNPTVLNQVIYGDYIYLKQSDVRAMLLGPRAKPPFNSDFHTNDTPTTATVLSTLAGHAAGTRFRYDGSIENQADIDWYRVRVADFDPGMAKVLTVSLNVYDWGHLIGALEVYDDKLVRVEHRVLVNGNGQLVVQTAPVDPRGDYLVKVTAAKPGDHYSVGNYRLQISVDATAALMQSMANGSLAARQSRGVHSLFVAETQMFHLALTASQVPELGSYLVWATMYNDRGDVVYRGLTKPGETRTANSIVLAPGTYTVYVDLLFAPGFSASPNWSVTYDISGIGITDPIGPELLDPSERPFQKCDRQKVEYCYPGGNHSPNPYLWVEGQWINLPPKTSRPAYVDPNAWYWYRNWLIAHVPPDLG